TEPLCNARPAVAATTASVRALSLKLEFLTDLSSLFNLICCNPTLLSDSFQIKESTPYSPEQNSRSKPGFIPEKPMHSLLNLLP
ncbi:MAG: hypothetical protein VW447_01890, partial [Limnobacter sp.]